MNNHRDHLTYLLGKSETYLITFPNLALQMKPTQYKYSVCAHTHAHAHTLCCLKHHRQIFLEDLNAGVGFSFINFDL